MLQLSNGRISRHFYVLRYNIVRRLQDYDCATELPYVCTTTPFSACPKEFVAYRGKCLLAVPEEKDMLDAQVSITLAH